MVMIMIKKKKETEKKNTIKKKIRKIIPKKKPITEKLTLKEQVFSMIYFEILGFIFCLLVLFLLSGGRNYLRLYSELNKLINVYDTVTSNYYGDLDKKEMIDKAINSMINDTGDNYTVYTDKEQTSEFLENIESKYEGIGCTVATNDKGEIFVVSIFDKSPAQKAGLKEDDIILKVDGIDYREKNSADMAEYVKSSTNTKIELLIKRKDEEKTLTISKEKIEIPTVTGQAITKDGKKIGYIDISIFSSVTTKQFKNKLKELEKEGIQGLIIDVRNNTGGYLSNVTEISSLFLKKGQIIYQLENNNKIEKIKDKTDEHRTYPVAVLTNAVSASASEIIASAIKESYKGSVVGTNTYGKGTVQKTKKLKDGTMIKYTVQKWLTPDGNWIDEKGVTPTDFIELKSSTEEDNNPTIDKQYEKALEVVTQKIK